MEGAREGIDVRSTLESNLTDVVFRLHGIASMAGRRLGSHGSTG